MKPELIQSLKDLQMRMPAIIQQFGKDNNFTRIALANPIAALERAGFQFTEAAKEEIENYVRFGREGLDKLQSLRQDMYKHFGGEVQLNNKDAVADAVIRMMPSADAETASKSKQSKSGYTSSTKIKRDELLKILNAEPRKTANEWHNDLQPYSTVHPVIPLLIEYRKLQAENPPFARPEQIPAIEEKLRKLPLKNVVFTLQRNRID